MITRVHFYYNRTIWLFTWILLFYLFLTDRLNFWGFVCILIFGSIIANLFNVDNFLSKKLEDELKKEFEERKTKPETKTNEQMHQEFMEDFRRRAEAYTKRITEEIAAKREVAKNEISLSRDALEQLRNTLLKHHNSKGTDKSYQESKMSKDTTALIQMMNATLQPDHRRK